jgi:hypothetical protein
MTVLTPETLEEWHTAATYLPWVKCLINRVKSESDGLERIRLRRELAKELMCEAFPIGLLAASYFKASDQVRIRLKVGNQNFDALVEDKRSTSSFVEHIEVTLAGDGEEDYLRMFVLHEHGQVSGLGRLTKTGTCRTVRKVRVANEMVSQEEVLAKEKERLTRAIERKLRKPYPDNTLLLIAFDDTIAFNRSDSISNLETVLSNYKLRLQAFHSVALVGLQESTLICRRMGNAI